MKDLIEALTILAKYCDSQWPTNCCYDELRVNVDPAKVSAEDIERLEDLGFCPVPGDEMFTSFRFGSC